MRCLILISLLVAATLAQEERDFGEDGPIETGHYDDEGQHNLEYDHQAFLGTRDDTDWHSASDEERVKRLKELIPKVDTDSDGKVTQEELSKWIEQNFHKLDLEDTKTNIDEIDKDKDEKVSWEEYSQHQYHQSAEDLKATKVRAEASPEDEEAVDISRHAGFDERKFGVADADKDMLLSFDELNMFLHPYNFKPTMQFVERDYAMSRYDTDKDGSLSLEEFVSELHYLVDKGLPIESARAVKGFLENIPNARANMENDDEWFKTETEKFHRLDINSNSFLDGDEIIEWVVPPMKEGADAEASHLISQADFDNDGTLTVQEFVDNYWVFVGGTPPAAEDEVNHEDL